MPISLARVAAFDILLRIERESAFAPELLHSRTSEKLSSQDHALATQLVMGVLRWRSRLDDEISSASAQTVARLDTEVLIALRLALYQFRWLDRIPKRAALNESVELVKRARKRSAAGFVNAVLRKLSATKARAIREEASVTPELLARELAHPQWLVERWTRSYGIDAAQAICRHDQSIPVTAIRLRNPAAEGELVGDGIALEPGALMSSARRIMKGDVTKTKALGEGRVTIQDEASQLVAALVGCNLGVSILDCCAAPGGKTMALLDRNPKSSIMAVELHPHRARLLRKLVQAADPHTRISVLAADITQLPTTAMFARALADVPCSGTGTLGRNPEIKWRLKPEDLLHLQSRQRMILLSAMARVSQGGRLIYSTCSLEREENEDVVEQAIGENTSFHRIECAAELQRLRADADLTWLDISSLTSGPYLRTIPGVHPCDGFFAAILERK